VTLSIFLISINRKRNRILSKMGVSEGAIAQIFLAVDQEVKKQVEAKLTKYAEYISKRHDISLRLLIEDIRNMNEEPQKSSESISGNQCIGICSSGRRCKRSGGKTGYCPNHISQKKPVIKTTSIENLCRPVVRHTHSLPPLFLAGCPACERAGSGKLLIEM